MSISLITCSSGPPKPARPGRIGKVPNEPKFGRKGLKAQVFGDAGGNWGCGVRDAGGWASATVVSETYAHADVHDPAFDAALRRVWGQQR